MAYDEGLANRIREAVAGEPGVTEKRMFGGLAFLVHGNMGVAASSQVGYCCGSTRPMPRASPSAMEYVASRCAAERWTAGSASTAAPSRATRICGVGSTRGWLMRDRFRRSSYHIVDEPDRSDHD